MQRLGDVFGLASIGCLFVELICFNRLVARLNSDLPPNQRMPRLRRTPFQLFREYRQVFGNNDLPRICMFWLLGFMILLSASFILGGPF